jgi:hypothetical protein
MLSRGRCRLGMLMGVMMAVDRLRAGLGNSSFGHDNLCNYFSFVSVGKKGNGSDLRLGLIILML